MPVICTSNDDQRLLALHVGFNRFPHAHDLTLRLDPCQRTLLHLAVYHRHFVDELRVGKGGALCGEVVAAMGGVGIEVFFRQTHRRQIFAGGAGAQNGVGRRQVVGGDVVRQHRQWTHTGQRALPCQCALPIRWAADVGAHFAPVVQRLGAGDVTVACEHRFVDAAELFRLHAGFHNGVDFRIRRPDIFQVHGIAVGVGAQHVFFDVEAHRAGNRIGNHQRWRCEERLFGVRVDTAIEIAVAAQNGGDVQVAFQHFLLNCRI